MLRSVLISYISFIILIAQAQEDSQVKLIIKKETIHSQILNLHYRSQINQSSFYFKDDKNVHSSVKPMVVNNFTDRDSTKIYWDKSWKKSEKGFPKNYFRVYPIAEVYGGVQLRNNTYPIYSAGLGLGTDLDLGKFKLTLKTLPYYNQAGYIADSMQTYFDQDMGTNRSLTNNVFHRSEIIAAFNANKFITILGGYGKNFFGEGYRSLLLSDNAAPNPFMKIETSFAGIKYVNLYNAWIDNTSNPYDNSEDIRKFSAIHYLSWNITRELNFSVFETVVWQSNDTLANRGFDLNYLNPVVFYRPVEYGLGSSDNVLLGANLSYKFNNHHNIYGQFILDEFLLSEIQEQSRWWANKYGWQIGYKSNAFFNDQLYFQLEFNGVRPFTYSHKSSQHAYANLNAPVTHPIGANFMELLQITSFKIKKHRITNKLAFASYGKDKDSLSYGQNIFKSYKLRPADYDQLMMQGVRNNVLNETIIYEYALFSEIDLYLTARYNWRMVNTSISTDHFHTFTVGLRSRIWNSYNDF